MIRVLNLWTSWRILFPIASFSFAFLLVVIMTTMVRFSVGLPVDAHVMLAYAMALALIVVLLNGFLKFLYQSARHRTIYQSRGGGVFALLLSLVIATGIFWLLPLADLSVGVFELTAMAAVFGLLMIRAGEVHVKSLPAVGERVLVYGVGSKAKDVKQGIEKAGQVVSIVGFYPSKANEKPEISQNRILPREQSLTDTVKTMKVDEIVVALTDQRGGVLPLRELLDCKLHGVRVYDLSAYFEQMLGQIRLDALRAGWLIFGDGFRQGVWRSTVKRLFDIVCATGLIVLAAPIMLLTAVLIAWESGFPIFYRQERVGQNGRLFNVIKFRSMRTDAEKDGKPRWATAKDDRVTRVGRVIRKLRIDELPQLFSVLIGHMSLVGPRPERPYFVDQLTQKIPYYAVRHSVKPGVTGWAQVRHHYTGSVEGAAEKLQFDLYYVKNHTLILDMMILLETVGVVLTAKGAQ
jgi:sugar transferase (PEP-CTERM system associated)